MRFLTHQSLQKAEIILFYLLLLFLPTQLGKHFWPDFALISGIQVDYLAPTIYVTDIFIVLLFLMWLVTRFPLLHAGGKQFWIFVGFTGFLLMTIAFSGNPGNGLYHLLKFFEYSFLAFYVAQTVGKTVTLETIAKFLAIGVVGESLLAIAQSVNHGSLGGVLYYLGERTFSANTPGIANASINGELILRPYATFPHPNVLAGYLILSMLLLFFFLFSAKKTSLKLLAVLSLFLGTSALLLTLSRIAIGIWVIFVLCIFIWQIGKIKKHNTKQAVVALIILLLLLTAGWLAFSPNLTPRFFQTTFTEEAVVQRSVLISAAATMIAQHPVFGVGLGNFLPEIAEVQSPLSLSLYLQPVHNIFFLTAAEVGLVGLGIFVWFLLKLYYRLLLVIKQKNKHSRESFAMILILSSVLLLGQFDHYFLTLQQGQLLFAFVIGLCFTAGKTFHFG